jgi:hypothetical protein
MNRKPYIICAVAILVVLGAFAVVAFGDQTYADGVRQAVNSTIEEGKKGHSGNFLIGIIMVGVVLAGFISLFSGK